MQVLGLKRVDYVSKKTGKHVLGHELHVTYEDKNILGAAVERVYLGDDVGGDLIHLAGEPAKVVGLKVECDYNRFGSVTNVRVVK